MGRSEGVLWLGEGFVGLVGGLEGWGGCLGRGRLWQFFFAVILCSFLPRVPVPPIALQPLKFSCMEWTVPIPKLKYNCHQYISTGLYSVQQSTVHYSMLLYYAGPGLYSWYIMSDILPLLSRPGSSMGLEKIKLRENIQILGFMLSIGFWPNTNLLCFRKLVLSIPLSKLSLTMTMTVYSYLPLPNIKLEMES